MTPPLFILAPGRSFTSITCAMIGCHPQMFGLAEINLFVADTIGELQDVYRLRARAENGLLRSIAELAFAEQTEETIEAARRWLANNAEMPTAELFRTMQEWAGGRGLVDKSPIYVFMPHSLDRIERTVPGARYLHLTRHPGDTVTSSFQVRRKALSKLVDRLPALSRAMEEHHDAVEKMWFNPHLAILGFLENIAPERQKRLRGEDLLADPPRRLAEIAEWLGIAGGAAEIDAMMHPENSPFAAYGPSNAKYGNDPNFMERPHLRPFTYEPHRLEWKNSAGETIPLSELERQCADLFGY